MRVCIIGAGVSGIVSAKYLHLAGIECEILEAKSDIGGTWMYSENVGIDNYGFKFYSAMYPGLRTNLPKEVMSFPDFQAKTDKSFLTQEEVKSFLDEFIDTFNIRRCIQSNREVLNVKSLPNNKFQVKSVDKPTNTEIVDCYDVVMVCTGVYNEPVIPVIPGVDKFKGISMHSSAYRHPDVFKNKRVLVIGAGPSGKDIVLFASEVSDYVTFSHHRKENDHFNNKSGIIQKPDVSQIIDHEEVEFVDGSRSSFDVIVYCTGYKRHYPFLKGVTGLSIENYHVKPLYKHMIFIENPNLCFIGLPNNVCAFRMIDLQARFYTKYLDGSMELPSKEDMTKDTEEILRRRAEKETKLYPKGVHSMSVYQQEYFKELSETAQIESIPPVIVNMWQDCVDGIYGDISNFREFNFRVLDDCNFVKTPTN